MYTDTPDADITLFTQGEINKGKISYKPTDGEIGIIPRMIDVVFDVQDASGNITPGILPLIIFTPYPNNILLDRNVIEIKIRNIHELSSRE